MKWHYFKPSFIWVGGKDFNKNDLKQYPKWIKKIFKICDLSFKLSKSLSNTYISIHILWSAASGNITIKWYCCCWRLIRCWYWPWNTYVFVSCCKTYTFACWWCKIYILSSCSCKTNWLYLNVINYFRNEWVKLVRFEVQILLSIKITQSVE